MSTPTWDILIASIVHRTDMLTDLLGELKRQLLPGVGVRVFRDNLETEYGAKCQRLLDSSNADYVSMLDDDDWIVPDYIKTIRKALRQRPDYVGFNVDFTENGIKQMPVYHTLKYGGWVNNPEALYRDIVHFNPIRRDLAVQAEWSGGAAADVRWAEQLRGIGCVKDEVYIDRELLHYRHVGFSFTIPPRLDACPPQPSADWVTWVT